MTENNKRVHELKTWPWYFDALIEGRKKFELRKADRGFAVGDTLLLREFEPSTCKYTSREARFLVSYLLTGPVFGLEAGWSILGLDALSKESP